VKIGEHGGVTLMGTILGVLGTLLIGSFAYLMGMFSLEVCILTASVGGIVGFVTDSILGATIQRKGLINNSHVNLISTLVGGLIAIPLVSL
jgi:uncharacterized protein (TIGR00297 family)